MDCTMPLSVQSNLALALRLPSCSRTISRSRCHTCAPVHQVLSRFGEQCVVDDHYEGAGQGGGGGAGRSGSSCGAGEGGRVVGVGPGRLEDAALDHIGHLLGRWGLGMTTPVR